MTVAPIELESERLRLRQWLESDRDPWARMNADPDVRRYFPGLLSRAESDASADRFAAGIAARGWGLWALEVRATGEFIGFVGLQPVSDDRHPVCGSVEIGWRLARGAWGSGFATEAGGAALVFAFEELGLAEVVSFTAALNVPSRAVMERLGMTHDPAADFDHPDLPPGHPLRRHVLYATSRHTPLGGSYSTDRAL